MALDSLSWFSLIVTSYLIGGIPTAYLATRMLIGRDIRQLGDHNSGAANVYRNVSARAGLTVGAIDIFKGSVAILLVKSLVGSTPLGMAAGIAVVAGHNWPLHLGLRGGRGAATAIGVLMAMLPALAIPVSALAMIALFITKKAVIGLGLILILVPVLAWPVGYDYPVAIYAVAIAFLVGLSHHISVRWRSLQEELEQSPEQAQERARPQG